MRRNIWVVLAMLLLIPGLLLTTSCAKKQVQTETAVEEAVEEVVEDTSEEDEAARQAELERQRALEAERLAEEEAKRVAMMALNMFQSEDLYFDFDSAVLSPMSQEVLQRKADWMNENMDATVIIEGHCDERGTAAYNLALGERRADAAKDFMVNLGIAADRITTISYGEEKPVDPGKNEEAWAKNRRAHFVVE
ncbi:MAG: peptidoglycan-associated lipoprotein Pal [Desulfosarcinaceae bacterium]|nr:peptidoglycan-associated lipoprotein Pal [Desulfosarcinaceae bacterium]